MCRRSIGCQQSDDYQTAKLTLELRSKVQRSSRGECGSIRWYRDIRAETGYLAPRQIPIARDGRLDNNESRRGTNNPFPGWCPGAASNLRGEGNPQKKKHPTHVRFTTTHLPL